MMQINKFTISLSIVVVLLLVTIVYSNHFHNSFHFDDSHTIENNVFIRDIKNIPLFFKDGTTNSSLPQNQSYRPIVSTSLAIDYWLGKGYNLFYFHLSTFIFFLMQGVLMFLFYKKIFNFSIPKNFISVVALIAVCWYMFHPAVAETINYIIARSDLLSTFWLLLGFVLYMYSPFFKRTFLYLLPVAIGALAKPTAVMFAPIFFFYILFFEENRSLSDLFKKSQFSKLWIVIKKVLPAFIICLASYILVDKLTPKAWVPGGDSPYLYLITQPFVILYYFYTLFFPVSLSADTDWTLINSISNYRFFIGSIFIVLMLVIAWRTSKTYRLKPISFGILWFFLALIPSSSIIPLAEVMNDHRMYFPFVGLILSVSWAIDLMLVQLVEAMKKKGSKYAYVILLPIFIILPIYAFATYQRNKVWKTEESLWYDVTIKSPKNGRGMMNYGLTKMEKGDYKEAEKYFLKALELTPNYSTLHVNLAILNDTKGDKVKAEEYFKKAIALGPNFPASHFFYAKHLFNYRQYDEATAELLKTLEISPSYVEPALLLMSIYQFKQEWGKLRLLAERTNAISPNNDDVKKFLLSAINKKGELDTAELLVKKDPTAKNYLDLSLLYYRDARFLESIEASKAAVKLDPKMYEAYNNMGSAYNLLQQYDLAILQLKKALALKPDFDLAKNNLKMAEENRVKVGSKVSNLKMAEFYLNQSLGFYNQGKYEDCIKASKKALEMKPDYDLAYNNICSAYNQLGKWDKAIEAGQKGININPKNQLLKSNLDYAIRMNKTKR